MKSRFQNWSDVRVFLAVARHGSTLAASKTLGLAQPTVARRIEALEHALGLTLFDRDTRGFRPTQAACALLAKAEAMEAAAGALDETAQDLAAPQVIRITGYSVNLTGPVTDIISGFAETHPDVSFELLPSIRVFDLKKGEADIALRLTWTEPDPDLICRQISLAQFTLYGSASYADKHGLPASPAEMVHHRILSFHRNDVVPIFRDWLVDQVTEAGIARSFSEAGLHDAAIRAGHGLGLFNLKMAAEEEQAGKLVRCFDPPKAFNAPYLMLMTPETFRRPEVKAFVKYFAPRYRKIFAD